MSLFIKPDDEAYVMPPVYNECLAWLATLPDDKIRPPVAPAAGFLAKDDTKGEETARQIVEMFGMFLDEKKTRPLTRLLLSDGPLITTSCDALHRTQTGLQPAWYAHNPDDTWTLDEDIVIYIVYTKEEREREARKHKRKKALNNITVVESVVLEGADVNEAVTPTIREGAVTPTILEGAD